MIVSDPPLIPHSGNKKHLTKMDGRNLLSFGYITNILSHTFTTPPFLMSISMVVVFSELEKKFRLLPFRHVPVEPPMAHHLKLSLKFVSILITPTSRFVPMEDPKQMKGLLR